MIFRDYATAYVSICGRKAEYEVDPDRLWAAREAAHRSAWMQEAGYRVKSWKPGPGTPAAYKHHGLWWWEPDIQGINSWFDHPYKLIHPDGHTIFVAEPYHLNGKALASLASLEADGWDVSIDAGRALWFPGRTLAVWIERKGPA